LEGKERRKEGKKERWRARKEEQREHTKLTMYWEFQIY